MNGVINVYKEAGYTSHDVVAKLRGILRQKKIGHTGTLDPDAVGVLPVCLGKATKLCDMLAGERKTYEAVLRLGVTTDTQDMSGTVLHREDPDVTDEEVQACIKSFEGEGMQIPPMYSALKVNGKKLYELAREGRTVERKARPVHFYRIEILEIKLPRIRFQVTCSKGTYIRTLCHDIGEKLGCGGCMESLVRTEVGRFKLADSLKLDQIEEKMVSGRIGDCIFPLDQMFDNLPALTVTGQVQQRVYNGNGFHGRYLNPPCQNMEDDRQIRVYDWQGDFVGIYRYRKETDEFRLVKMFRDGGGKG
ncbi:MAG: tRNA pseudouridine(55) synthase TruB [Ruminococcus sp.]|jgi:tRNA pseudouridine55 synthase